MSDTPDTPEDPAQVPDAHDDARLVPQAEAASSEPPQAFDPEADSPQALANAALMPEPPAPRLWGVWVTLLGLGAAVALMLCGAIVLLVGARLGGAAIDPPPMWFRYATVLLFDLVLVFVAIGIAKATTGRTSALGFRPIQRRHVWRGVAAGALLLVVAAAYSVLLGLIAPDVHARMVAEQLAQREALAGSLPLLLVFAVVAAPLAEEIFFRGFLFQGLVGRLGVAGGAIVSGLVFAAAHGMPLSAPVLLVFGIVAATVYDRSGRSLASSIALHMTFNLLSLATDWLLPGT